MLSTRTQNGVPGAQFRRVELQYDCYRINPQPCLLFNAEKHFKSPKSDVTKNIWITFDAFLRARPKVASD